MTGFSAFPALLIALLVVRATLLAAFFTVLPTFVVKRLDRPDLAVRVAMTDAPREESEHHAPAGNHSDGLRGWRRECNSYAER